MWVKLHTFYFTLSKGLIIIIMIINEQSLVILHLFNINSHKSTMFTSLFLSITLSVIHWLIWLTVSLISVFLSILLVLNQRQAVYRESFGLFAVLSVRSGNIGCVFLGSDSCEGNRFLQVKEERDTGCDLCCCFSLKTSHLFHMFRRLSLLHWW